MSSPSPSRRRRLRLTALALSLLLALFVTGVLAWQAVAAEQRQRVAAANTLGDYAEFAAFVLGSGVRREAGLKVLAGFATLPPWGEPSLFAGAGVSIGCGEAGVYFEFDPQSGEIRHTPGGLTAAAGQRLADTLQNVRALFNEAAWRFRYIRLPLDGAADEVFIVPTNIPGGFGVRGMTSCLWDDESFQAAVSGWAALPPTLTGNADTDSDSLFGMSIHTGGGENLFSSGPSFTGILAGSSPLGSEFGDLALSVDLNPQLSPDLLIGGTPQSRAPSALVLFGLSSLLLAAAVALLRREYRVINARSDFVSSVSHELRTPLSQILIFTELLRLDRLADQSERSRALGIIDAETRRLIRLVENILQFSRRQTETPLATEPLELAGFTRETVEAFRPLAAARRAKVELDVPESLTVRAERNALRQVMLNLLDNAVKYGPEGQSIRVEAREITSSGEIQIAFDDQGPGIPIPDRERIWEGFERIERDDLAIAGSGIGLSVVKSLAARMSGHTSVGDAPTGGARFTISLPNAIGGVA